jgi:hypothetical protein
MRSGRALSVLVSLALATGCALPRPWGDGIGLQANFLGGYRALHDHPTLDGHATAGLELVTCDPESGWGYELGGSYGSEEPGGPREHVAEIDEVYLGLRRAWVEEGRALNPYLGFGGSWVRVENGISSPTFGFDDDSGGAYLRGGALWSLGRFAFERGTEIFLGLDGRGLIGDEVDAAQLALVLGFGR